jgi:hypothetical protein
MGLRSQQALVKGWHDEQLLSVPKWLDPTRYVFEQTYIRAALIPVPDVDNLVEGRFQSNWTQVATILLERDPPPTSKYARWGLKQGENRIELKWEPGPGGRQDWQVQMWPPGSVRPVPWHFNKREKHFDAGIPGTVRFRWTIMDDGIWAPCGQTCCQVEGEA